MKTTLLSALILFLILIPAFRSSAQLVTFESQTLPASQHWAGNPGVPGITSFQENGTIFFNQNDTSSWGDTWSGWGYSATTDTIDATYANQMSCIAGKGHNNSTIYGVAYLGWDSSFNRIRFTSPRHVAGFYVTNTTVAYRSMQNGDFLCKKFGGTTGNDPDYFRLDITGWYNGNPVNDTIQFYLADFRDANNANDYIVKDWRWVNLSALGPVDSLTYNQVSTDNNSFGMLTPSYFCMDDMESFPLSVNELSDVDGIEVYPVPMQDELSVRNQSNQSTRITLLSINGQQRNQEAVLPNAIIKLDTHTMAAGIYHLRLQQGEKIYFKKLIKP